MNGEEPSEETVENEEPIVSDKDVIVLTDSNFDSLLGQNDSLWLIEFYAPWCGHCKSLDPEWSMAATELKGKVKLGKVDCTVNKKISNRFSINGYPTIYVFPPGVNSKDGVEDYDVINKIINREVETQAVSFLLQLVN